MMTGPNDPDPDISCERCEACCCRLEVLLITDTGVPQHFVEADPGGGEVMARLDDGWCAALDRRSLRCMIYERRPWVCREFEMGGPDCIAERESQGFRCGISPEPAPAVDSATAGAPGSPLPDAAGGRPADPD